MGLTSLVETDGVFLEGLSNPPLIWGLRKHFIPMHFFPNPPQTPKFRFPPKQTKNPSSKVVVGFFPKPFLSPHPRSRTKSTWWKQPGENHQTIQGERGAIFGRMVLLFDGSEIRLTSWYGESTIIYRVSIHFGWLFGISCRMVLVISTFGLNTTQKILHSWKMIVERGCSLF